MSTCIEFFKLTVKKRRARKPESIAKIRAQMRAHVGACPVCSGRVKIYRKPLGKKILLSTQ